MNIERFLLCIRWSPDECPADVHPARWRGMVKWFKARKREGDQMKKV